MAAAIITGIVGLIAAVLGVVGTVTSTMAESNIAQKEREHVDEVNKQQREYELEDREYLAMREDTAYQRKAEDMAKAGINPLMAGMGSGAQAQMQPTRNTGAIPPSVAGVLGSLISNGMNGTAGIINTTGQKAIDTALNEEERLARIDKLRSETKGIDEATREKAYINAKNKIELETFKEQKQAELQNTKITNEHIKKTTEEAIQRIEMNLREEERIKLREEMEKVTRQIEDDIKREELKLKKHENEMTETEKKQEEVRLEQMKQSKVLQIIDAVGNTIEDLTYLKDNWFKPWNWGKDKGSNKNKKKKGK